MFLFGLRDRDLIAKVLKVVLCYVAFLFLAFLLPPVPFYICAVAGVLASAGLIVADVAGRYPAISFGSMLARVYAFPRNPLQRRTSRYYAVVGTIFFFMGLLVISSRSGSLKELSDLGPAMFVVALGYPGVVNLILLRHPVSRLEEGERA